MARRNRGDMAKAYAKLLFMEKRPELQNGRVNLLGMTFNYGSFDLFLTLFREVFMDDSYALLHAPSKPFIIDAGGNIGMATMYFKYRYPEAEIHVFEPDDTNFDFLERNIRDNQLENVHAHKIALSDSDGTLKLYTRKDVQGGDIGVSVDKEFRANYHDADDLIEISVPAKRLSGFIDRPIDLFKLDVEGAEELILRDLDKTGKLAQVHQLSMEYHQVPHGNPLSSVLKKFEDAGMRYEIGQWGTDTHNVRISHCFIRAYKLSK